MDKLFNMRLLLIFLSVSFMACQSADSGSSSSSSDWINTDKSVNKTSNGKVSAEGYSDATGTKNGPWVDYHPNKELVKSVAYYVNGKKNGPYIEMSETNNVKEKSWYVDGLLQGERIIFNRTRIKERSSFKDNKLDGKRTLYYDNGKLQEEGDWVNGNREGIAKWYNQEEVVTIQYEYKNGEKIREVPISESAE